VVDADVACDSRLVVDQPTYLLGAAEGDGVTEARGPVADVVEPVETAWVTAVDRVVTGVGVGRAGLVFDGVTGEELGGLRVVVALHMTTRTAPLPSHGSTG
jgi:hypothetical protein